VGLAARKLLGNEPTTCHSALERADTQHRNAVVLNRTDTGTLPKEREIERIRVAGL
jgi:hypothetical protein